MKKIFSLLLTVALVASLALAVFITLDRNVVDCDDIYPATGIITKVDRDSDLITFETFTGFEYQLRGCEDWLVDDFCAVIMYKVIDPSQNETLEHNLIANDEVVDIRNSGYLGGWQCH